MQDSRKAKIKDNFELVIEYDKEEKNLIISCNNSSGATYDCDNINDLKNVVQEYIDNYIDYEYEMER